MLEASELALRVKHPVHVHANRSLTPATGSLTHSLNRADNTDSCLMLPSVTCCCALGLSVSISVRFQFGGFVFRHQNTFIRILSKNLLKILKFTSVKFGNDTHNVEICGLSRHLVQRF